jgi:hypothetical protein
MPRRSPTTDRTSATAFRRIPRDPIPRPKFLPPASKTPPLWMETKHRASSEKTAPLAPQLLSFRCAPTQPHYRGKKLKGREPSSSFAARQPTYDSKHRHGVRPEDVGIDSRDADEVAHLPSIQINGYRGSVAHGCYPRRVPPVRRDSTFSSSSPLPRVAGFSILPRLR